MSTPFELNQIGADSLRQHQQERLIEWTERVFAEPVADGNSINPRFYEQGFISREQEIILYKDLYSRDTELGLGLINWRKSELLDAIAYLKSSVKKREYSASLARSRQESLDKLATTSNLAQTQYAEQRATLTTELELLDTELTFLRAYSSKIDALERVVKLIGSESTLRVTRSSEQILRLFSQSWRGLVKIKAWVGYFSDEAQLPVLQLYKQPGEPAGFILPLGEGMRAVAISRETAGYLLHLLKGINSLAEAYRKQLIEDTFNINLDWGYPHMLIRAIVEVFYFCNFEMPFSYVDLAIDPEDPSQLCVYNYDSGEWEMVIEDANSSRTLKRVGAEASQILVNSVALLKCHQESELSEIIRSEAAEITSPGESHNYRLFMCSGLSEFDLDPANQRVKFRMAFGSMAQLLESIVEGQNDLTLVKKSVLGGALQTVLGMALIDSRAFSLPSGVRGLDPIGRFQLLSSFWRLLGRRRAIAMLGEDYVKQVTSGLASLGEQGPEHPTFLTMRVGTVMSTGSSVRLGMVKVGEEQTLEEPPVSPFTSLGLSDQIRLLDLAIQSWKMSEELLEKLREVRSQGKLKRILEHLPTLVASRKEDIQMRFNSKWLVAQSWQWTFMRSCAPVAWDFWTKLSSDEPWDNMLLSLPPYQALGQLLRLFSDIVRLMLIIELSGSEVAESIQVQAESAGQTIMMGLEGFFREGERLPPQVAEAVNFYYNPEIRFDSWLAFTSSFRRYLGQMKQDLKLLGVNKTLLTSISGLVEQIEILYPASESEKTEETVAEPQQEEALRDLFIDEANAEQVEFLLHNVLNVPEQDSWTFFKLLSLTIRADKRNLILLVANNSEIVTELLPDNSQLSVLFNTPTTAKTFFNYLSSLDLVNNPPSEETLEEMRPKMIAYFNQLSELYSSLVPIANQIPNFLPQDRKKLSDYLANAPQKSSGLSFLILLACNRLVVDISETTDPASIQAERAESKIRAYLREQINASVEEPSVEVYPIGGGRILARKGQCIITHQDEGFEPLWCELTQPCSRTLYSKFITKKFSMIAQLLSREFPDYQILVR